MEVPLPSHAGEGESLRGEGVSEREGEVPLEGPRPRGWCKVGLCSPPRPKAPQGGHHPLYRGPGSRFSATGWRASRARRRGRAAGRPSRRRWPSRCVPCPFSCSRQAGHRPGSVSCGHLVAGVLGTPSANAAAAAGGAGSAAHGWGLELDAMQGPAVMAAAAGSGSAGAAMAAAAGPVGGRMEAGGGSSGSRAWVPEAHDPVLPTLPKHAYVNVVQDSDEDANELDG